MLWFGPSSYPQCFNLCSEAVVDGVFKTWILIQCSFLIAPLRGYMNRHFEERGCSFQTLDRKSLIAYFAGSISVVTRGRRNMGGAIAPPPQYFAIPKNSRV